MRHGTCFHRRLSTHHAGAAPHSAVAELGVVRRRYPHSQMLKLVVHVAVALSLWLGLAYFGFGAATKCGAVVAGAVAVHFIWERVFFNPFLYLGAMPVSNDDPLMAEARRLAAESMPTLHALFPEHRHDTTVRFALAVKSGKREKVWGDLLELTDTTAKVYLRTPPVEEADIPDRNMTIPVADIDDWQIEFADGTLRGGFTIQAMFRIFERQEGYLHPAFHEQQHRFRAA